eukprot:482820-Ditylum_brightwellii.AAC.1
MYGFNNAVDLNRWPLKGIEKETSKDDEPKLPKSCMVAFATILKKLEQVITNATSPCGAGGKKDEDDKKEKQWYLVPPKPR